MPRRTVVTALVAAVVLALAVPAVAAPAFPGQAFAAQSVTDQGPSPVDGGRETAGGGRETVDARSPAGGGPAIAAVYPDPVADEDVGEFVVVDLPAAVDPSHYAFTDGEATASLANASAGQHVAVANHERARNLTEHPVLVAPALSLANGGEHLRVVRNGTTVDERRYRDATEGQIARWNGTRVTRRPLGATDRPVVRADGGTVKAFVLPDAGGLPAAALRDADDRLLLAGYTFSSEPVADALIAAERRDVDVRVLLEGDPVGGRTSRAAETLDRLVRAGVEVRLLGGPHDRYAYHHPKYAVVDDRAIVLTENWKPAGTGGNSSRGWGVATRQPRVVAGLVETFRADADWRDARPWVEHRRGRTFERGERARGSYPTRFEPTRVGVERTDLLVAPDNARSRILETVDRADESIDVVQVSMGEWDAPLGVALRRAAARGVEVRILLSGAWYVSEETTRTVERYREWASRRDAPLSIRQAEPGDRFEKIHAKGAVVDGDTVVLGSLNWNDAAATENREVVLALYGEAVAGYYGDVFAADWGGGRPSLPVGLLAAVAGGLVLAGLVARKLEFGE